MKEEEDKTNSRSIRHYYMYSSVAQRFLSSVKQHKRETTSIDQHLPYNLT